jgi:hypothetical protein
MEALPLDDDAADAGGLYSNANATMAEMIPSSSEEMMMIGGGVVTIGDLPEEILENIFGRLSPYSDLDNIKDVCRRWNVIAKSKSRVSICTSISMSDRCIHVVGFFSRVKVNTLVNYRGDRWLEEQFRTISRRREGGMSGAVACDK